MTQRQINQAYARKLKPTYKHLTPQQKKLVKLAERWQSLDKSVNESYRWGYMAFGEEFRKHPDFQETFTMIGSWENMKFRIRKSISRLEDKYNLDEDEVMKLFNEYNRLWSYGGSF